MQEEQMLGKPIGWARDVYLLSPLWSRNFAQTPQQIFFMWFTEELVQRPKTHFFKLNFYEMVLREKEGTNWCPWRGLKSCCCCIYVQRMMERTQNDTRIVEHLGSIQRGVQCFNVPYIYDSDMLQWSACTYWNRIKSEKPIHWVSNSAPV